MRASAPVLALLLPVLLWGCPKRHDPALQVLALLQQADILWQLRGRNGLDAAGQPLLLAYGLAPADPRVLWRIARWRIAEGSATDDRAAARSSFAEARAVAAGCLEHDPGFATRLADGWAGALADLPPERLVCVAWTALAWARWAEVHGAEAASLDLPAIDALVAAASESTDADVRAVADWAAGISLATRPAWAGQDLDLARDRLRAAAAAEPRSVVIWADLWRLVAVPTGDAAAKAEIAARIDRIGSAAPDEVRAAAQVAAGP